MAQRGASELLWSDSGIFLNILERESEEKTQDASYKRNLIKRNPTNLLDKQRSVCFREKLVVK